MSYLEIGGKRVTIPIGEIRIGSDPSGQMVLTGDRIQPKHAIVQGYPDGQVAIRRGSEEAEILVNGVRLGPQPTPLLHGDKVQVGSHELLFVDERRSGSTQYVQAVDPASLAAMAKASGSKPREATAATGGRVVSLTDGREYVVSGQSTVFGRDAGCDVVITDKNVSRRHAEIMATPKGYVVIDSSTNGTFVNGERVEGQRLLARADVIRIGNDEFRFYADRAPAAPPAAPAPDLTPQSGAAPQPAPRAQPPQGPAASASAAEETLRPAAQAPAAAPPSPGAPPAAVGAAQKLSHTVAGVPLARPPGTPAAAPAPPPAAAAQPPGSPPKGPRPSGVMASLVIRSGSLKGQRLPIRVPIVNVGRADYNDVMLPDDSVSTSHAKLQRREGVWVLVDLESTNGCFVDGERVQGETPIAPGALLRFGDIQVLFEPTDDTVDAAKGSSTKMLSAIKLPATPPPAAPAPPASDAPPGPRTQSAGAPAPSAAGPAVATIPERPAVIPKAAAPAQPRRPAPRPRPAAPPSRPAQGGLPKWVVVAAVAAVLGLVIIFLLLR